MTVGSPQGSDEGHDQTGAQGGASASSTSEAGFLGRRAFISALGATLAGAGVVAAGELWSGNGRRHPPARPRSAVAPRRRHANEVLGQLPGGQVAPIAPWLVAENSRPGTTAWAATTGAIPGVLDGYADTVSAQAGSVVHLFVSCQDPTFHVEAYRMGYYGGAGARLYWRSGAIRRVAQPPPVFTPGINMVECHWAPCVAVPIGQQWLPGYYLFKIVASGGQTRYIPLVVRDDTSRATYVVQSSVCTWQAYNSWGGYSQYFGPPGRDFANRARVVSFDRPYYSQWAFGAADFFGNEFPLVMLVERLGLDVTYWTDVDFHARPNLLGNHRTLISLGHDEYWSPQMFQAALAARDQGVNFAFLGANAVFRRIRLDPSPTGPFRRQVCYKVASEDPFLGKNNALVTANFPDQPSPSPESLLMGNMYQSNGVKADMVICDGASWVLEGTGLATGARISQLVGPEYDGCDPAVGGHANLDVIAHSPVVAFGQRGYSDMTWQAQPGKGGVFTTGTNWWVYKMSDNANRFNPGLVPLPSAGVTQSVHRITENVLAACGLGPAGDVHPSSGNWARYYPGRDGAATRSNYRTSWPA